MNRKSKYKNLERFRQTRNAQKRRYNQKTQNAPNSHQLWTENEIELVLAHTMPDMKLAKQLGRSVAAIQTCRKKYGRRQKLKKEA